MTAKKSKTLESEKKLSTSFYRKVIHNKQCRLINLTPIMPKAWNMVEVKLKAIDDYAIHISIIKIAGEDNHAQITATDKQNKLYTQESR